MTRWAVAAMLLAGMAGFADAAPAQGWFKLPRPNPHAIDTRTPIHENEPLQRAPAYAQNTDPDILVRRSAPRIEQDERARGADRTGSSDFGSQQADVRNLQGANRSNNPDAGCHAGSICSGSGSGPGISGLLNR